MDRSYKGLSHTESALQDVLSTEIFKDISKMNKSLLKKLNDPDEKEVKSKQEQNNNNRELNNETSSIVPEIPVSGEEIA